MSSYGKELLKPRYENKDDFIWSETDLWPTDGQAGYCTFVENKIHEGQIEYYYNSNDLYSESCEKNEGTWNDL